MRSHLKGGISVISFLLCVSACGGLSPGGSSNGGDLRVFTPQEIRAALHENGFQVEPTDTLGVGGGDISQVLANFDGQGIVKPSNREGAIGCNVRDHILPAGRSGVKVQGPPFSGEYEAFIVFANVDCILYPTRQFEQDQVERVKDAFLELDARGDVS